MAEITKAVLSYGEVYKGCLFDTTFELVTNVTVTGKLFIFQVRRNPEDTIILTFKESDGSLVVSAAQAVPGTDQTTRNITLHKDGDDMNIAPSLYRCGLMVYSDLTDPEYLTEGTFDVLNTIPKPPTP